jgi:L-serine dehydratase
MESIKKIFRIGHGPSSSHTMGPSRAAIKFKKQTPEFKEYKVTLYGSLAATGKGHLTDIAIQQELAPAKTEFVFDLETKFDFHPNALKFEAIKNGNSVKEQVFYSVGGGKILKHEERFEKPKRIYSIDNMEDILNWHKQTGKTIWELVFETEDDDIEEFLWIIWQSMKDSIHRGLTNEGLIPGGLKLQRKARSYYIQSKRFSDKDYTRGRLFSYALAVAEENATAGVVVTAPTCGSAGVLPAVLYGLEKSQKTPKAQIIRALATAGIIGNLVKKNASISGAEVGCQGEIGTACAMAAAAATQLLGGSVRQIEYAAEMGLEHHLGLTCDPIKGLVQVPCIERNVHAASRAFNSANYALMSDGNHLVSFDNVTKSMNQTGKDMPSLYRETALGGLAFFANSED